MCVPDGVVCGVPREADAGAWGRGPVGKRRAVGADDELGEFWHDRVWERGPAPAPNVGAAIRRRRDGASKLREYGGDRVES